MFRNKQKIFYWFTLFILSFFICFFIKDQVIVLETQPLNLKPNDLVGVFDTQTKHFLGKSGWITGINFEVIGAPKTILHHIVVANLSRQDWTCPSTFPERLHATAKELTPMELPKGYGYFMDKRERLASYVHLYNPTLTSYDNVIVKIKISFLPVNIFKKLVNTQPIWLDIKNCTWDATVYIPPNTAQTLRQQSPYRIPFNSKLIYAFGHIHNYGEKITITKNNSDLIEFSPLPDSQNIEKIKFFINSTNATNFQSGDFVNLVAEYNNSSDNQIDAMGLGVMYLEKY